MLPLYHDPHFTFRFAEDRLVGRFHLDDVAPGTPVTVFALDPATGGGPGTGRRGGGRRGRMGQPVRGTRCSGWRRLRRGRGIFAVGGVKSGTAAAGAPFGAGVFALLTFDANSLLVNTERLFDAVAWAAGTWVEGLEA
jgi:hypothetical protein